MHGLGWTETSFVVIEQSFDALGYHVVNLHYPSTEATVQQLLGYVDGAVAKCGDRRVNFVTHSMGGILARAWLADNRPKNMGRVVMLAPPNKGSEIVDALGDLSLYRFFTGPAGLQLGTGPEDLPHQLGPVDFELGVIAGSRTFNPVLCSLIQGDNDGKVSVASTMVQGMTDHIVLPVTHTWLMNNPLVIGQTVQFIEHGRFDRGMTTRDILHRFTVSVVE
nr:alpha/beta fold hydrolase [Paracoccus sp. PAR01]